MKFTFRDLAWAGIVTLIVVYLSKCHRDETYDQATELIQLGKAKDSAHKVERQEADNKLTILLGQMQNAAEKQQATDRQLTQSITTIARLSAGVKAAKLFPEDTTFTMVSPEYINYCDSLAVTSERVYDEFDNYKKKTSNLILAKDTAISFHEYMLKRERAAYAICTAGYNELVQQAKRTQQPRNQIYLGAELIGNQYTIIQNVGAVVSLKTKSNKLWQISGGLQSNGGYYGRINGNILISFKK